ncbi:hypothetical protein VCR3J2_310126 [Vibrio coralliirubri]|nr:hypothetical protein VCR3J2_310126 [Vibrio coralliirubri]
MSAESNVRLRSEPIRLFVYSSIRLFVYSSIRYLSKELNLINAWH